MLDQIQQQLKMVSVKGFLAEAEAEALYRFAFAASAQGPCLEIGSYCGLSSLYLAAACAKNGSVLYALDHHRGSEEHQPGEPYHDSELFDAKRGVFDTFQVFRSNIEQFNLDEYVIPIVASSQLVCQHWQVPLSMLFIDGGHSDEATLHDFLNWPQHLNKGGILAVHDIFQNPLEGGQAPFNALQALLKKGDYDFIQRIDSMEVYRKKRD